MKTDAESCCWTGKVLCAYCLPYFKNLSSLFLIDFMYIVGWLMAHNGREQYDWSYITANTIIIFERSDGNQPVKSIPSYTKSSEWSILISHEHSIYLSRRSLNHFQLLLSCFRVCLGHCKVSFKILRAVFSINALNIFYIHTNGWSAISFFFSQKDIHVI